MRPIQENTKANIFMILEVLQKYGQLNIRGIGRAVENEYGKKLNPYTINRIVTEYLADYLKINDFTETLGIRLKFCSLKEEYASMDRQEIVRSIIKRALDMHQIRLRYRSP